MYIYIYPYISVSIAASHICNVSKNDSWAGMDLRLSEREQQILFPMSLFRNWLSGIAAKHVHIGSLTFPGSAMFQVATVDVVFCGSLVPPT